MPRRTRLSAKGQAWRRDAGLGRDKAKRLAKIQEAMAALEADARLAAEEERPHRGRKRAAAQRRRPQEAGQTGVAAIGTT